jgi:hypothetical protein
MSPRNREIGCVWIQDFVLAISIVEQNPGIRRIRISRFRPRVVSFFRMATNHNRGNACARLQRASNLQPFKTIIARGSCLKKYRLQLLFGFLQ